MSVDPPDVSSLVEWLTDTYGPPPSDVAPLVQLRQRYPLLANITSCVDIINISPKYLVSNAIKTAGDHAVAHFASNPRLDLQRVRTHMVLHLTMLLRSCNYDNVIRC